MTQKGVYFKLTGRVQGVGMRFYISRLAHKLNVKGYVKNTRDGSVIGEVVGDIKAVDAFFIQLPKKSPGFIENIETTPLEQLNDYQKFKVKLF